MSLEFIHMVLLSVKRRSRSMWKVALISFLCVCLFVGIMVFQDCMNQFQREVAFLESGEWIVSTEGESRCMAEHAWVDGYGTTLVRTSLYNEPKDGNMDRARKEGPIGVVDDFFLQLSNIVFYAGRMPEQADEIALTQHVLSDMGCSYELDQILSLAYVEGYDAMGNPIFGHIQYKLVGILENYTADWVLPEELPEFFVTMEGLEQIDVPEEDQQRCYYYLNRAQRDIIGEAFYQNMRKILKNQGEDYLVYSLVYNENAYDVTMWGNQTMYLVMMSLCGVLGSMSLIYLFLMCCNNRRPYYFKLRELGAGIGQVREMVCIEWSSVFIPAACAGIIVAGVISVIVAAMISRHFGIPFVFHLTGRSIRLILLFTIGVFLLVMLWSCLFFQIRDLHQMTGIIPPKRLKHMYRKRDREKNLVRVFQLRRKRAEPGKNIAQILFLIATLTIFLYSVSMIQSASRAYSESKKLPDLYVGSIGEGWTAHGGGFGWDDNTHQPFSYELEIPEVERNVSVGKGLPTDIINDLEEIPEVQSVSGAATDNQITLLWNSMQDSHFLNNYYTGMWIESPFRSAAENLFYMEEYSKEWDRQWHEIYNKLYAVIPDPQEHPEIYEESVVGIERTERRDLLLKKFFGSRFRSDDFWSGKQSILFQVAPTMDAFCFWGDDTPTDSPLRKQLQGVMKMNPQNQKSYYG
ncbi:MAG: ABC transporter permease, partial [Lachnospiraceae bacterium]|nr:ABC transporter permease [Lachnospiraceae bacterium]